MAPEIVFSLSKESKTIVHPIAQWIIEQGGRPSVETVISPEGEILILDMVDGEPIITYVEKTEEGDLKGKFYFGKEIAERLKLSGLS